jgi:hypothetical protein
VHCCHLVIIVELRDERLLYVSQLVSNERIGCRGVTRHAAPQCESCAYLDWLDPSLPTSIGLMLVALHLFVVPRHLRRGALQSMSGAIEDRQPRLPLLIVVPPDPLGGALWICALMVVASGIVPLLELIIPQLDR